MHTNNSSKAQMLALDEALFEWRLLCIDRYEWQVDGSGAERYNLTEQEDYHNSVVLTTHSRALPYR